MRQGVIRIGLGSALLLTVTAVKAAPARHPAPVAGTDCVFDIASLPVLGGKVVRLLPGTNGDVAGAILDNGAEVVLPPGLASLAPDLKPGAMLRVRGLWSGSLKLIRAFALAGQPAVCASPVPEYVTAAPPMSAQGVVVRLLHDGDGAVNGALLTDGTVLRVPAAGVNAGDLVPGKAIYADGAGYRTHYGVLLRVDVLGPSRGQAQRVSDAPPVPRGAAPGSPAYDEISSPGTLVGED